jgi:hypothetical protein
MVIADLTERNSNVFYELAVRHMIDKPIVQVIRTGDPVPFDVASLRVLQLPDPELENYRHSQELLREFIRAAEKEPGRNPISSAASLDALRRSGDPLKTEVAQMKEEISQLRAMVQNQNNQSEDARENFLRRLAMETNQARIQALRRWQVDRGEARTAGQSRDEQLIAKAEELLRLRQEEALKRELDQHTEKLRAAERKDSEAGPSGM